jgi:hypothetical protein
VQEKKARSKKKELNSSVLKLLFIFMWYICGHFRKFELQNIRFICKIEKKTMIH